MKPIKLCNNASGTAPAGVDAAVQAVEETHTCCPCVAQIRNLIERPHHGGEGAMDRPTVVEAGVAAKPGGLLWP